jgi:hypothetical protein
VHGVACERYHAVEGAIRDRHGYTRWRGIARDLSHASPLCLPPIQALTHEGGCTYSLSTHLLTWYYYSLTRVASQTKRSIRAGPSSRRTLIRGRDGGGWG